MGISNVLAKIGGTECLDEGGEPVAFTLHDEWVLYKKTDPDGGPGNVTPVTFVWVNPYDCNVQLVGGKVVAFGSGITGNASNYATLNILTDDGNGSTPLVALAVSTLLSDAGSFLAGIAKAFTQKTPANTIVPPGGSVFFSITKNGSGVVVPIGAVVLRLRKQG